MSWHVFVSELALFSIDLVYRNLRFFRVFFVLVASLFCIVGGAKLSFASVCIISDIRLITLVISKGNQSGT